jgi:hypothetical protein
MAIGTTRQSFKFFDHIGNAGLMSQLEANLKTFVDWSLLKAGGFTNIDPTGSPTTVSGAYGGSFGAMRLVDDPTYIDGQVWETARKDWVWESGVDYIDATGGGPHNPLDIGIPVIDGVETTGTYVVNYPQGRIIFDDAIATTSTVQIQHAFRDVQVYVADDAPWWRQLQFRSFRPDSDDFTQVGSGDWSILSHHRVQFPAIVLEAVPRGRSVPYELGNPSLIRQQDILFHVLAEYRGTRNNLVDAIANQADDTIWLFDVNEIATSSAFPLTFEGDKAANPLTWPDLIKVPDSGGFRWKKCRFTNATVTEIEAIHLNLYEGTVRMTTEIILGTI